MAQFQNGAKVEQTFKENEMSKLKAGDKVRIIGYEKSGKEFGCKEEKRILVGSVQTISRFGYDSQDIVIDCVESDDPFVKGKMLTFFVEDVILFEEPTVDTLATLMTNKVYIDIPEGDTNLEFIGYAFAVKGIYDNKLASPIFISDENGKLSKSATQVKGDLNCYLKPHKTEIRHVIAYKNSIGEWYTPTKLYSDKDLERGVDYWQDYKILESNEVQI